MSKETFKSFARFHPELATTVLKGEVSWQQLYELYEIYGEDETIWKKYINNSFTDNIVNSTSTIKDFINSFKNMDMDSLQQGIQNIQKAIGLLQDIGLNSKQEERGSHPIYERFHS